MTVLNLQVGAAGDDRQQDDNTTTSSSALISVGTQLTTANPRQHNLWRFSNVTIPQGATINSASFSIRKETTEWKQWDVTFYGLNADTITSVTGRIDTRPKTTANTVVSTNVNHNAGDWVAIDVKNQIQEIVNRAGWASGNNTAIIAAGTGSSNYSTKTFNDYSDNATYAAKLDIDYTAGAAGQNIDANFISVGSILYGVTLIYDKSLDCNFISSGSVLYGPTIAYTQNIDANFISSQSVTYDSDLELVIPQGLSNPTIISMGSSGALDNMSSDGVTWPSSTPLYETQYGKLFFLVQDNSGSKYINFAYSNDNGETWTATNLTSETPNNRPFAVDEAHKIIHILFVAYNIVVYRRFTWTEDGSHNITGFTRDNNVNLVLNEGAQNYNFSSIHWFDDAAFGTYGAILACWASIGSNGTNDLRASMRVLSNDANDNNEANWTYPITNDSNNTGDTLNVPISHIVTTSGGGNLYHASLVIPSGIHAHDVIFVYDEYVSGSFRYRSRRMVWDSEDNKWTNGLSNVIELGNLNQSGSGGYQYKFQLLSKLAYLEDNDSIITGLCYWKNNTDGDSWAIREIYNNDTVSSIVYLYSPGAENCGDYTFVTGDVAVDEITQNVVVTYTDLMGHDIWLALFDSTLTKVQDDLLVDDTRPYDIPTLTARLQTDQAAITTRNFNVEARENPPTYTPPYQGYFVTLDWLESSYAQNINGAFIDSLLNLYGSKIDISLIADYIESELAIYGSDLIQEQFINAAYIDSGLILYGATVLVYIAGGFINGVYYSIAEYDIGQYAVPINGGEFNFNAYRQGAFIDSTEQLYGVTINTQKSFDGSFINGVYYSIAEYDTGQYAIPLYGSILKYTSLLSAAFLDSTQNLYGVDIATIVEISGAFIDSTEQIYGSSFEVSTQFLSAAFIDSVSETFGSNLHTGTGIDSAFIGSTLQIYGSDFIKNLLYDTAFIDSTTILYGSDFIKNLLYDTAYIDSTLQIYGSDFINSLLYDTAFINSTLQIYGSIFNITINAALLDSTQILYGGLIHQEGFVNGAYIDSTLQIYGSTFSTSVSISADEIQNVSILYGSNIKNRNTVNTAFISSGLQIYGSNLKGYNTVNAAFIDSISELYGSSFGTQLGIIGAFIDSISELYGSRFAITFNGAFVSSSAILYGSQFHAVRIFNGAVILSGSQIFGATNRITIHIAFISSGSQLYGSEFSTIRILNAAFVSSGSQTYAGSFYGNTIVNAGYIDSISDIYAGLFHVFYNILADVINSQSIIYSGQFDRTIPVAYIDSTIQIYPAQLYASTNQTQFVGFIDSTQIMYGAYFKFVNPYILLIAKDSDVIDLLAQHVDFIYANETDCLLAGDIR